MISTDKIIILEDSKAVAKQTAEIFVEAIRKKPNIVLGLSTGETFIPVYRNIVKFYRKKKISFAKVKTFNLDEFYGIKSDSMGSLFEYMEKNLFGHINLKRKNIYFLNGGVEDWKKECDKYEREIKKVGGIDLQFLGLGVNGHIGFNEPWSLFASKTRKVKLTDSTRKAEVQWFGSVKRVPRFALTMGIRTILSAGNIILVATGKRKAQAVKRIVYSKPVKKIPASVLCKHKNVILILDEDAASEIKRDKYNLLLR